MPWVRDAWGSTSTSRTRRPALARVPPRLRQLDDLPTPPFLFSNAITATAPPSAARVAKGNASRRVIGRRGREAPGKSPALRAATRLGNGCGPGLDHDGRPGPLKFGAGEGVSGPPGSGGPGA